MKEKLIPVSCAIIYFDDKILAVQRSTKMKLPLKWEFPGGKVEAGESEVECVKREVFEELNIEIEVKERLSSVIHQYPNLKVELIPFIAYYQSGNLQLAEHADYVLSSKKGLLSLDWAEADLPIVKQFLGL